MVDVESPREPSRVDRARYALLSLYLRLIQPSTTPLRRQLLVGLAAYAVLLLVLVAFGINGSSMGLLYSAMFGGRDPGLLRGVPRAIRSDEWLVVAPLTVSQVEEGLPYKSGLFPAGSTRRSSGTCRTASGPSSCDPTCGASSSCRSTTRTR